VWQAWHKATAGKTLGKKYKKKLVPVTVFKLITGGALQKIGEFDNQAEASAAAGISGQLQKNGLTVYRAVRDQLQTPSKRPSKATASSSGGSYYFIYTFHPTWVCHHRCRHQTKRSLPSAVLKQPRMS
jgi:hypothetical protein